MESLEPQKKLAEDNVVLLQASLSNNLEEPAA
jgi:hypothetical protein